MTSQMVNDTAKRFSLATLLFAFALFAQTTPTALAQDSIPVLICVPGGAGSTADAKERLAAFFAKTKEITGLSMNGEYHTSQAACDRYFADNSPKVAVFTYPTFVNKKDTWKLEPVVELVRQGYENNQFVVVSRKGTTLDQLKGKKLASPHWDDAAFLSKVAFDSKIDFTTHFAGVKVASALKAIKELAKGQTDAILLDENEYRSMQELPNAGEFAAILTSDALPGAPMVVLGTNSALTETLRTKLPQLCQLSPEACTAIEVKTLKPATLSTYETVFSRASK
ncbi:MAG: PhnD/SsuA/transferrin family substrate-binding protein [Myxococcales bacterium]|nr:PhnD/SsuA/transferrin family substrate-binding protein [Myxococcales bacterium]